MIRFVLLVGLLLFALYVALYFVPSVHSQTGKAAFNGSELASNTNARFPGRTSVLRALPVAEWKEEYHLCTLESVICPNEIEKEFIAIVTKYNSVAWQTDSSPCRSANGDDICTLKEQGLATCASRLPFGTRLFISGVGECVVRDRMNQRYGNKNIDWYEGGADKIDEAKKWGAKRKSVLILKN